MGSILFFTAPVPSEGVFSKPSKCPSYPRLATEMFQACSHQCQYPRTLRFLVSRHVSYHCLIPQEVSQPEGNLPLPTSPHPGKAWSAFPSSSSCLLLEGSQNAEALLEFFLLPITCLVLLNQLGGPGHLCCWEISLGHDLSHDLKVPLGPLPVGLLHTDQFSCPGFKRDWQAPMSSSAEVSHAGRQPGIPW